MAIPFFEPRNAAETELSGDQVDGATHTPSGAATSAPSNNNFSATISDLADEVMAWKLLALALCKALKQYYLQAISAKEPLGSDALPNGKVKPAWRK